MLELEELMSTHGIAKVDISRCCERCTKRDPNAVYEELDDDDERLAAPEAVGERKSMLDVLSSAVDGMPSRSVNYGGIDNED